MGFEGYINSDSGITHKMAWGVEELDVPERIGLAVNTGVDIISGSLDVFSAKEAYERGKNGYYTAQGHPVPEGYRPEQLVLTDEVLDRAVMRTLEEQFRLGMFDNPYREPEQAVRTVAEKSHWEHAHDVHRRSVVLLKNRDKTLPLKAEKLAGKKIYVECFQSKKESSEKDTATLREMLEKILHKLLLGEVEGVITERYEEADYALLFITPASGEYFNATKGYLELDICEKKQVADVDEYGCPAETCHEETTLSGAGKIRAIYEAVHGRGGKVISNINFTLAWEVGNVEPYADALLAGFNTYMDATLDVVFGEYCPIGRMPVTLPKDDSVLQVNADGICISPNDVPGYDKDLYMPEEMKDENGKAYAYRDSEGHYYELDFGLSF